MNDVMKPNRVLGNAQPDRTRLTAFPPQLSFIRIKTPALARINRLAMFGGRPLPLALQFFFSAKTQIGFVLAQQPFRVLAVYIQPVRLTIRTIRAAHVRPFVPIKAEPLEIVDKLIFIPPFA